jgi:hypothetical protein
MDIGQLNVLKLMLVRLIFLHSGMSGGLLFPVQTGVKLHCLEVQA